MPKEILSHLVSSARRFSQPLDDPEAQGDHQASSSVMWVVRKLKLWALEERGETAMSLALPLVPRALMIVDGCGLSLLLYGDSVLKMYRCVLKSLISARLT